MGNEYNQGRNYASKQEEFLYRILGGKEEYGRFRGESKKIINYYGKPMTREDRSRLGKDLSPLERMDWIAWNCQ